MTALLLARYGARQPLLVHARAPADVELLRLLVELVLAAAIVVHAAEGLALAAARRLAALRGARIGGTLVGLRLPMVADLLERVLERGERGAMGARALAVFLHRAVMGLDPGALRLCGRALERTRQSFTSRHVELLS